MSPTHDYILVGATGYTGRLCVQYMVHNMPQNVRWAIAGRNKAKVEAVAAEFGVIDAGGGLIVLDLSSYSQIEALAKSTRILVNVAGPYATTCGSKVFQACAENGTHYVDRFAISDDYLSIGPTGDSAGEPVWRQDMIREYENAAKSSGAKMVITCGWGAVPADVSAYLAVQCIRRDFQMPTLEVIGALYDIKGSASGGAVDSICTTIAHNSLSRIFAATKLDSISPVQPVGNPGKRNALPAMNIFGIQKIDGMGILATHFHEPVDLPLVGRSWGLHESGLAQQAQGYGPNFRFSSRMLFSNVLQAWLFRVVFHMLPAALLLPPVRILIGQWLFPPGTGATVEQRGGYRFTHKAIAVADTSETIKPKALVEFHYPGDANEFTAMSMTEAGLLLLREENLLKTATGGGIYTPASLGDEYVRALQSKKVQISVHKI